MRAKAGYSGRPGKGPLVSVTAAAALKSTEAALAPVTPDAAFEAAELVCCVLGVTKTRLYLNRQAALTAGQQRRLQSLVRRRQQGQPLQYLLGRWSFYNVELLVGPGVLIPRADTEILVQQLLQKAAGQKAPVIADYCSGSGAVAIASAKNLPGAKVFAVEKSKRAYAYLCKNILLNGVQVQPVLQNAFLWQPPQGTAPTVIACNPPYIPKKDLKTLAPEVQREPAIALNGGADGLYFYRRLVQTAKRVLAPGGWLLFEVGIHQSKPVCALLQAAGYCNLLVQKDLNGIERVVGGQLPG